MNLVDFLSEENADKRTEAQDRIDGLGHIEKAVLYLWVVGYTQAEIGEIFGYSQQHISRILAGIQCVKVSRSLL